MASREYHNKKGSLPNVLSPYMLDRGAGLCDVVEGCTNGDATERRNDPPSLLRAMADKEPDGARVARWLDLKQKRKPKTKGVKDGN